MNWITSSNLFVSSGQGTSSAQVAANGSGSGTVRINLTDGCGNPLTSLVNVGIGAPVLGTINWDGSPNNGPVAANSYSTHYIYAPVVGFNPANYSWNVTNNSGNISTSLSGINGANAQVYVGGTVGNSTVNITASNACGSSSSNLTIFIPSGYRVASNPAKESLAVEFIDMDNPEALPAELSIVSEKTKQIVYSKDLRQAFKNREFVEGNKILFDIKSLPRERYYLKVMNPKQQKGKQIETTRLIFE